MQYGNRLSYFSYLSFLSSLYIKVNEGQNIARLQNIAMRYKIIIVFAELHKEIMIAAKLIINNTHIMISNFFIIPPSAIVKKHEIIYAALTKHFLLHAGFFFLQ